MKRLLLSLLMVGVLSSAAHAHFIWIVPEKDGKSAKVIFSDSLEPDDVKLLAKIAKTEVYARGEDGKRAPIKWTEGKDAYILQAPGAGPQLLGGTCAYGVIARGGEPFQLNYYATALVGANSLDKLPTALCEAAAGVPLQIVPVKDKAGTLQVLWEGKPLANAEVVILAPGKEKAVELKAGDKGTFELPAGDAGLYGIRVRHVEAKAGKAGDKEFKETRHYATLVVNLAGAAKGAGAADKPKEDPAATKLLADARAARAQWAGFPGFSADVEVNFDGKIHKGKVHVGAEGKVRTDGLDKDAEVWARRTLGSTVNHRIDNSSSLNTPCAFLDDVVDHPQGRAIRVLNDELHSSYRIKDKQIMNRAMKGSRFTIEVLEQKLNAENKYLSVSFVINFWDLEKGELTRNEATHQTWTRVGKFDLPVTTRVLTATPEKKAEGGAKAGSSAQTLTLSNHKLLEAGK